MDSQDTFWLCIWGLAAGVILGMATLLCAYNIGSKRILANAKDPLALACAVESGSIQRDACLIVQSRGKQD